MSNGKVNIDWVADAVLEAIPDAGYDLSVYTERVERDIATVIAMKGIAQSDMDKEDVTDYYTSPVVISLAILLYQKYVFFGFWGGRSGDTEDIYREKYEAIMVEYRDFVASLTAQMLYKVADEDGNPASARASMNVIPIGGGASL